MSTIRRLGQLLVGLWLFGASIALLVRAELGLDPWDVLHQGLAERIGASIGTVVLASGAVVLLLWLPLRQRPGVGTVMNVVLVGVALDTTLSFLPTPEGSVWRGLFLVLGIAANGVATALYLGAGLGPGPRDGLMTGLAARGLSIRRVRTALEAAVLAAGWLLGGTVGIGTVVYAVSIGPLVHHLLPVFTPSPPERDRHEAPRRHRQHPPRPDRAADRRVAARPGRP